MAYEFRARGVGELIDATFRIYRAYWWTLVKTAGALLVPAGILQAGMQALANNTMRGFQTNPSPGAFFAVMGLAMGMQVPAALYALTLIVADAAVTRETADVCHGAEPQLRAAWLAVKERLGPVIGAGALAFVLTLAGFCFACGLGGIVITVFVALVAPAIMLESARVGRALQRTFRLVGGGFWRVVGTLLTMGLIMVVPALLMWVGGLLAFGSLSQQGFMQAMLALSTMGPLALFLYYMVSTAYAIVVAPLWSILKTLVYFDLRIRQEGYDLDRAAFGTGLTGGGAGETVS